MDEELEQGGQENNRGGGSFNNPLRNIENKANNVKDGANKRGKKQENKAKKQENKAKKLDEKSKNQTGKAAKRTEKKAAKASKKAAKHTKNAEKMAKVASKAGKVANAASKLASIMATVGLVLIIIIAVIGILVFILTGLGLIMQGLKEIVASIWNAIQSMGIGEENIVGEQEIIDTADYLEQMGYDLYGYGFTTKDNAIISSDEAAEKALIEELGEDEYEKLKKKAEKGDKEAKEKIESKKSETGSQLAYSDDKDVYKYLTAYLISDNYAYTIKNSNKNFVTAFSSPGTFFNGLTDAAGWGSGLISLYHQEGDDNEVTGKPGEAYGLSGADYAAGGLGLAMLHTPAAPVGALILTIDIISNWDDLTSSIVINRDDRTLTVNGPGLFNSAIMEYSLDGWMGRYSMPLEFLLSTHLATMAPDLSYKMATSFNTDVEIILFKSADAKAIAGLQTGGADSKVIQLEEFEKINDALFSSWDWASALSLSKSDALTIIKQTGIKSYDGDNDEYHCYGPEGTEEIDEDDSDWATVTKEEWNRFGEIVKNGESLPASLNNLENGENGAKAKIKERLESLKEDYTFDDVATVESELYKKLTISGGGIEPKQWMIEDDLNVDKVTNCTGSMTVTAKNSEGKEVKLRFSSQYRNHNVIKREETYIDPYYSEYKTVLDYREADFWIFVTQINQTAEVKCSDSSNTATEACDACHAYVKLIYEALRDVNDNGFDTYVPYINKVTNHWYRDVYFTEAAIGDNEVIQTDTEYEKQTGERWTLYEMNGEDPSQYELYVYLKGDDGEYKTELEKSIVCVKVGEGEKGDYKLSDDGVTYVKDSNGNYKLQKVTVESDGKSYSECNKTPEEFRVGKKAITQKVKSGWTAYGSEAKKSGDGWKNVTVNDESPESIVKFSELSSSSESESTSDLSLVYQLDMYEVEQIEDGVRGETNATIKKLFLDDYYIFDGSGSTAALIQKAKKMVKDEDDSLDADDPDSFRKLVKEGKITDKITAKYSKESNTTTIDEISGPVNLTHNSLSAFSMLENMHTLDAEYIYHDFKELIVELNYFDKEDLVEGEDDVLMFPISGISAAGWPVARYDKSEDFYGTLIHSATDYKAKRKVDEVNLVSEYGLDAEVDTIDEDTATPNTESKVSSDGLFSSEIAEDGSCNRIVKANGIAYKQFAQGDYTDLNNDGHSIKEGGCGICSTASLLTGYGYDVNPNDIVSKKTELGLKWYPDQGQRAQNIEKILESYGVKGEWKSPSSLEEIKKVLHDALDNGIPVIIREAAGGSIWKTSGGHYFGVVGEDSEGILYTVDSATKSDLARLVNNGGIDALANDINGHLLMIFVPDEAPDGTQKTSPSSTTEFAGYEGSKKDAEEYVVSPAAGEVLKYGTVQRTNIETGEKQDVGFIKIRLLGTVENKPGSECNYFGGTRTTVKDSDVEDGSADSWLKDTYDSDTIDKIGFDYFWEEYNDAGLGDHVVYIEGFDVSEVLDGKPGEDLGKEKSNIEKLRKYINKNDELNKYTTQYTVPNLLDETKEFELRVAEAAKKSAIYTFKQDGRIYIKEGAVIGKTYSSNPDKNGGITKETEVEVVAQESQEDGTVTTEMVNGVQNEDGTVSSTEQSSSVATKTKKYNLGNYMRIILRDTKDEVVEDCENYIEIAGTSEGESNFEIGEDYDTRASEGNCSVTKEQFKKIFADRSKIVEHVDDFYEMQDMYGVSAVFAAAVCIQEQGGGTADSTCCRNNNWFSQKGEGTGGETSNGWAIYTTVRDSIMAFGKNIAEGSYYYTQGKYKLSEIGPTYCEGNEWAGHISAHITTALKKI